MKKIIGIVAGVVVIAAVAAGAWYLSNKAPKNDVSNEAGDTVAIVDGTKISRSAFESFKAQAVAQQGIDVSSLSADAQAQLDKQIADGLVAQVLVEEAVAKSGITASQADVDAQIAAAASQLGGEDALKKELDARGLTEDAFRAQVSDNLATQQYLEQQLHLSSVTATDEEIQALYDQTVAADATNTPPFEQVRSQIEQSVIQQKQQALLDQLIAQLKASANVQILL